MNIILENNINFYDELNKIVTEDDVHDENDICLLTKLPLDKNNIEMECGHKFNLFPLYKEVCNQKRKSIALTLETTKLGSREIKCPYCRQKQNSLLPHIKINENMKSITGVNTPEQVCMKFHICEYMFKNGKNKDNLCNKPAYYKKGGVFCNTHHKCSHGIIKQPIEYKLCTAILKSGKRKDEQCNSKITNNSSEYCKRHTHK